MKKGLIYISYDKDRYKNNLHMSVDNKFVEEYISYISADELFNRLDKMEIDDADIDWCIVADKNASEWDFRSEFKKNGRTLNPSSKIDSLQICNILHENFKRDFIISDEEINDIGSLNEIYVLFPNISTCTPNDEKAEIKEGKPDNEDEMTELGKIIERIYEGDK